MESSSVYNAHRIPQRRILCYTPQKRVSLLLFINFTGKGNALYLQRPTWEKKDETQVFIEDLYYRNFHRGSGLLETEEVWVLIVHFVSFVISANHIYLTKSFIKCDSDAQLVKLRQGLNEVLFELWDPVQIMGITPLLVRLGKLNSTRF